MLYARDELDAALRHATEAVTLGRQVVESFLLALGLDAMAWIHQAMGDAEAALENMDEAYGMLPATAARPMYPGEAWRARLPRVGSGAAGRAGAGQGAAAVGAPVCPCRVPGPNREPHRDHSAPVAGTAGGRGSPGCPHRAG